MNGQTQKIGEAVVKETGNIIEVYGYGGMMFILAVGLIYVIVKLLKMQRSAGGNTPNNTDALKTMQDFMISQSEHTKTLVGINSSLTSITDVNKRLVVMMDKSLQNQTDLHTDFTVVTGKFKNENGNIISAIERVEQNTIDNAKLIAEIPEKINDNLTFKCKKVGKKEEIGG